MYRSSVSVIIPCYNRASLIGATIQNMLEQTLPPDEIIVVDDGSTDNSVEIIKSFGSRIKLIQQTNQGPGAARNAGLRLSKGELIQFMDSDDLASVNKLEVQAQALANTNYDFAYCPWVRCTIEDRLIHFVDKVLQAGPLPSRKSMLEYFLSGWSLVFQNCLFKRSILKTAGWYRTDLMPSEDSEYFVRILTAGAKAVHTPECLVFYREHNQNKITASGTSARQRARDWTHYLEITGHGLADQLSGMKLSTRIALVAAVKKHLGRCAQLDLPLLPVDHPYLRIYAPCLKFMSTGYLLYTKVRRRVLETQDYHTAFNRKRGGVEHWHLVTQMGYENSNKA